MLEHFDKRRLIVIKGNLPLTLSAFIYWAANLKKREWRKLEYQIKEVINHEAAIVILSRFSNIYLMGDDKVVYLLIRGESPLSCTIVDIDYNNLYKYKSIEQAHKKVALIYKELDKYQRSLINTSFIDENYEIEDTIKNSANERFQNIYNHIGLINPEIESHIRFGRKTATNHVIITDQILGLPTDFDQID